MIFAIGIALVFVALVIGVFAPALPGYSLSGWSGGIGDWIGAAGGIMFLVGIGCVLASLGILAWRLMP